MIEKMRPPKVICDFCGNEATLLCDMPETYIINSVDFQRCVITCDKNLCVKCATRVNGFDYCPDCVERVKASLKGI